MHEVRVHTDRRACITASLLKKFAEAAALKELPKKVFVSTTDTRITLRWFASKGSKPYDLSVRRRVLVARYEPGATLSIASVDASAMVLVIDSSVASKASRPSPPPHHPNAARSTRKEQPMSQFNSIIIAGLCADVRRNHTGLSLLEVAKALDELSPGVTVKELLDTEGRTIITYDDITKRSAGRTSTPTPRAHPPRRATKSASLAKTSTTLREFVASRLSESPKGISINDIAKDTTYSLQAVRLVLNKMIASGRAKKTGHTRATRYYPR